MECKVASHGGMHGQRSGLPTMPGQDAFGAIQEVVQMLEADPATDWSKVNIAALREHLIDMNEVTLHAAANERMLDNGIEIAVTGEGRTLAAIKRMVPAHVHELAGNRLERQDRGSAERRQAHGDGFERRSRSPSSRRSASSASWCRAAITSRTI